MKKRTSRVAAAVLTAMMLSVGGASMAFADPGNPYAVGGVNQENTSNTALINPDATVQLSIHKYLGATTTLPHNGTEQTVSLPALQGVNFDIYQVYTDAAKTQPVDLTTNEGWEAASAIYGYTPSPAEIAAGSFVVNGTTYYISKVTTVTTDGTGTATFTRPDGTGLYLVNENLATSGTITNVATGQTVDKGTITPASPFFVTLPMTNPTDTSRWMYDVNVYPKNQTDTATKSVEDKGTVTFENGNVGDHGVDYTITSSITDGLSAETMGMYRVTDVLDARLTYVGTTVAIDPDGDPATANLVTLDPATDYTLSVTNNADGTTTVVVNFTDAGLVKLAAANTANAAAKVVTTISTTVKAEGTTGVIPDMAYVIPNQGWMDANPGMPGTPTNEVLSKYGNLVINKFDPQDSGASMTGAVFAVYADPTPGDGVCSSSDVSGTPINTATITAGNTVTFTGLQASDWYNGQEQTALQSYCLVETKAPTGYNLNAQPQYIIINWATATTTAPAYTTADVANEKSNLGNSLPLTGGAGVAAISVLGLVLVGGGVAYYIVSSRRRDEEERTAGHSTS